MASPAPQVSRLGFALALAVLLAAIGVATYTILPKDDVPAPVIREGGSCIPTQSKWGKIQSEREAAAKKKKGSAKAKLSGAKAELPPPKK